MAAFAVSIDDFTAARGQVDACRIVARSFMEKIVQAGAGFISNFTDDVRVRQMAFRAGEPMMVG